MWIWGLGSACWSVVECCGEWLSFRCKYGVGRPCILTSIQGYIGTRLSHLLLFSLSVVVFHIRTIVNLTFLLSLWERGRILWSCWDGVGCPCMLTSTERPIQGDIATCLSPSLISVCPPRGFCRISHEDHHQPSLWLSVWERDS